MINDIVIIKKISNFKFTYIGTINRYLLPMLYGLGQDEKEMDFVMIDV